MEFLGKVVILTAAYVSPKFQHKPPHQWYLHIYADHPCRGHWCTPIPSQRLVFVLFIGNSLDGLFHLWHVESGHPFFPKTSWNVDSSDQRTRFHLSLVHLRWLRAQRTLQRFCSKINKCLPLCIIQFQVAFLDAVADCVEWQWFSKVLPSPCGYVHHGSMTISQTIPPEGSMVTLIQQQFPPLAFSIEISPDSLNFHNIMNCGWWKT